MISEAGVCSVIYDPEPILPSSPHLKNTNLSHWATCTLDILLQQETVYYDYILACFYFNYIQRE